MKAKKTRSPCLLLTCEHASNKVPTWLRQSFLEHYGSKILATHRAYDLHAKELCHRLHRKAGAPVYYGKWTRLCIDLNRSLENPAIWSSFGRTLPESSRRRLLDYYLEYRASVESFIGIASSSGPVLHISVHSFTPVLGRQLRNCDLGILYDPARKREKSLALALQAAFQSSGLRVRRNFPYRGTADGCTTWLRRKFSDSVYSGLELEMNQGSSNQMSKVVDHLGQFLTSKSIRQC
ncbi:MAG: N-formylglutamate amidohydrolase [Leptospiraceae bacterium]|nr:N-formylglutamate amidohydrolase [Leptospiraceae bacterium]